jgi:DNA-binding MarR family transcriptional regulator
MSPAAVGELAQTLRCDRSNVTRLIDRASTRSLFRRRGGQEDGRVTVVELTPEGERLARRFLAALEAQTAALRASWSRERQELAVDLLTEISDALDASQQLPRRGRRLVGGRM